MDDMNTGRDAGKVENSADDAIINDIISNIDLCIENYKEKYDVSDIVGMTQQQYLSILDYIRFNYFKPNRKLLYKYYRGVSNNGEITNMYNYYILMGIVEYYIYICRKYNKVANIYGFGQMTGIDDRLICDWGKLESQRPDAYEVYKKLLSGYENALENGAQSGKNPVGYIATLNHRFGWSSDSKQTLTVNINRNKSELLQAINQSFIEDMTEKP